MPINAGDAAKDAARKIRQEIRGAAHKDFRGAAKIPETPHVEPDVNNPEMHEHAGDQAPPLAAKHERAEIGSECDSLLTRGQKRRDAADYHDCEDECVHGDESDSDRERW